MFLDGKWKKTITVKMVANFPRI